MVGIENSSFGYDLVAKLCEKGYPDQLLEDPLIFQLCPLEANASHHIMVRKYHVCMAPLCNHRWSDVTVTVNTRTMIINGTQTKMLLQQNDNRVWMG